MLPSAFVLVSVFAKEKILPEILGSVSGGPFIPGNHMQNMASRAFFWTKGPELSSNSQRIEKNKNHSQSEREQNFLLQHCTDEKTVTLEGSKRAQILLSAPLRGSFGLSSGTTLNYGRISGPFVPEHVLFSSLE